MGACAEYVCVCVHARATGGDPLSTLSVFFVFCPPPPQPQDQFSSRVATISTSNPIPAPGSTISQLSTEHHVG